MAEKNYKKKPNGKNATGRPSKYTAKMADKLLAFFLREPYQMIETKKGPVMMAADFPTVEGFCASAEIGKETFYRWVEEYPEFRDAFARARARQTEILVVNGLLGNYNSGFAQFVAINCLDGWTSAKNKNENEQTGEVKVVFGDGEGENLAK